MRELREGFCLLCASRWEHSLPDTFNADLLEPEQRHLASLRPWLIETMGKNYVLLYAKSYLNRMQYNYFNVYQKYREKTMKS